MNRNELKVFVSELVTVRDFLLSASSQSETFDALNRLISYMAYLKNQKHPIFSTRADDILDFIQPYKHNDAEYIQDLVSEIDSLISDINAFLDKDVFSLLKKGYAEAKDMISDAIPEDVKETCKEAASQVNEAYKNTERTVKSKIRNWLLSDDET